MTHLGDDPGLADERVGAWFAIQRARREQQAQVADADTFKDLLRPANAPPPVITLARQIGCSGDAVARIA